MLTLNVWNVIVFLVQQPDLHRSIGIALPRIIEELRRVHDDELYWYAAAIVATAVIVRLLWVFPGAALMRPMLSAVKHRETPGSWQRDARDRLGRHARHRHDRSGAGPAASDRIGRAVSASPDDHLSRVRGGVRDADRARVEPRSADRCACRSSPMMRPERRAAARSAADGARGARGHQRSRRHRHAARAGDRTRAQHVRDATGSSSTVRPTIRCSSCPTRSSCASRLCTPSASR